MSGGEKAILVMVSVALVVKVLIAVVIIWYLVQARRLLGVVKAWAEVGRGDHEQARKLTQRANQVAAEMDSSPIVKSVEQVKQTVDEVAKAVDRVPQAVVREIGKDNSHG